MQAKYAIDRPKLRGSGRDEQGREALARAAIGAIEPLVGLFLEIGITSPEAESLLRGLFVHKSRDWLAGRSGGAEPSDVRIALVTGVHRNFVSRLLAEPPGIPPARRRRGHRASRLLQAWHTDPLYLDSSGKPRDLPERGPAPSFEALAARHVPGPPPTVVLQELRRAGVVQPLAEQRVRVRSRSVRAPGVNISNIKEIARKVKELLDTLLQNLHEPDSGLFCESLQPVEVEESRVAVVREVISRRAGGFLQSLHAELASERKRALGPKSRRVALSVTVFESNRQRERI